MKKRITIVSLLSVVSVFIACILAGNSIVSAKEFSYQYEVKHFSYKNADKYVFHKELKDKNETNNKEIDLLIEKYDLNKKIYEIQMIFLFWIKLLMLLTRLKNARYH